MNRIGNLVGVRFGLKSHPGSGQATAQAVESLARRLDVPVNVAVQLAAAHPGLLREVAGQLTVGESYFFRHLAHFERLARFVEERIEKAGRVTIWSAGCAGGEEPYTVAIVLEDGLPAHLRARVEILATDISLEAVERAKEGVFSSWSLRDLDKETVRRCFSPLPDGRAELRGDIKSRVAFYHLSIQEHLALMTARSIDTIFFRNVAIYLEPPAIDEMYRGFARVLRPEGLLQVSATDPKPPGPPFRSLGDGSAFVLGEGDPVAQQARESAVLPKTAPARRSRVAPERGRSSGQPVSVDDPRSDGPVPPDAVRRARALADGGDLALAVAQLDTVLRANPGDRSALLLRGQVCLAAARAECAVDDLRRVLFLDPSDGVARFWYALALRDAGRAQDALRQAAAVAESCERNPSPQSSELMEAAAALLEELR